MNSWVSFWQKQEAVSDALLGHLMSAFLERAEPLLAWKPEDVVLDIGCGPGHLERRLKGRVREIHGVDVSNKYIEDCRKTFSADPHLFFHALDPENYTDMSFLEPRRFSVILCHSVIQYYREPGEVRALIRQARRLALPGARFLIADIPSGKGGLQDAAELAWAGWRGGFLVEVLRTFLRLGTSGYRRIRTQGGLWSLDPGALRGAAEGSASSIEILDTPLTVHSSRRHLFLRYP